MGDWRPIGTAPKGGKAFILGRRGNFGFVSPAMYNNNGVLQTLDCPSDPSFFVDEHDSEYGEFVWKPLPCRPK